MTLRYGYTIQPSSISDSLDSRDVGVAFSEIAIVPRETSDPHLFITSLRDRMTADGVTIDADNPWEFPLPRGADLRLRLNHVDSECRECVLRLTVVDPMRAVREVWSGTRGSLDGQGIRLSTSADGIDRLRISFEGSCDTCASDAKPTATVFPSSGFFEKTGNNQERTRPHVFIYVIDTLRADVLSPYGGDEAMSPQIATFARDSVVYLQARAASTWTLP
jgi:hypothetical protein